MAANEGQKMMSHRRPRSISTDSGVTCQITHLKNETFKTLAKKDIEEKLLQGITMH